jgi:pyruvate kinase
MHLHDRPASRDRIPELIGAAMDIARINFSHGTDEEHREAFGLVGGASESTGSLDRHYGRPEPSGRTRA